MKGVRDSCTGGLLATLLALDATTTVLAHHDVAVTFDVANNVQLSGVIATVKLGNPHVLLALETEGTDGAVVTWSIEMAAPNALVRRRIAIRELLTTGRRVTVGAWPAKDGTRRAKRPCPCHRRRSEIRNRRQLQAVRALIVGQ